MIDWTHGILFLPFQGLEEILIDELKCRFSLSAPSVKIGEGLYYENATRDIAKKVFWAKYCATGGTLIDFKSIKDAKNKIIEWGTALTKNNLESESKKTMLFYPISCDFHRRSALISQALPYIKPKARDFPFTLPKNPVGVFSLIEHDTLVAWREPLTTLPPWGVLLKENHIDPPSRAYLKLEEALIMENLIFGTPFPDENDKCFDAGSSPGGWTWVLVNLGAKVFSVDRAPLDERLMKNPLVTFLTHDAFTLKPEILKEEFTLIASDVICYPERLFDWVVKWIESKKTKSLIATIKLQDFSNKSNRYEILERFASIEHSRVIHLGVNKHELTFLWHAADCKQ